MPTTYDIVHLDGVNLENLHPDFRKAIAATLNDPAVKGKVRASSGARTYAQQAFLRRKYGPGRAANPDYVGPDGRKGSKHMVQMETYKHTPHMGKPPSGLSGAFAYAVDIGWWDPSKADNGLLERTARTHGLVLTVFQPYEPWHFEPIANFTEVHGGGTRAAKINLVIPGMVEIPRGRPVISQSKRRANPRAHVIAVQKFLTKVVCPLKPDGDFGPKTDTAIKQFQLSNQLEADGLIGRGTWSRIDLVNVSGPK